MHATPGAQPPEPAGAAWRQQSLRVVQRTPQREPAPLPVGIAALLPWRTFAQHGLLGDPHSLVIAFEVENRGVGVAPLVDLSVAFAVPEVLLASDGSVETAWQDGGRGWSTAVGRIGDTAQVSLAYGTPLAEGDVVGATFRIRLRPDTDLSLRPIEVTATGYARVPDLPAEPSALALGVERLEL